MFKFVVRFFSIIGFVTVLTIAFLASAGYWYLHDKGDRTLPDRFVLEIDLRDPLPLEVQAEPLRFLQPEVFGFDELLLKLMAVKEDPRVAGLLIRLAETAHGGAKMQELWTSIDAIRQSGKPVAVWADSFGEVTPGNEGYLLATAASTIAVQPSGFVGLNGIGMEVPYFRLLLDKLGIKPEVFRRAEYKTALESFTDERMSDASAEVLNDLADRMHEWLVGTVAQARGLTTAQVAELIDRAPLSAEIALSEGLIDRLAYWPEFREGFIAEISDDREPIDIAHYDRAYGQETVDAGFKVGIIHASGNIVRGGDDYGGNIAADALAETLREATDRDVDAYIVRLDTGGGSAVGSDTIAFELQRLRTTDRPVIVSMVNAAASGGYWIAAAASGIVAQPATLTGSIGVIAGKPVVSDLLETLGIHVETISRGASADLWSLAQPLEASDATRIDAVVEQIYTRFKKHVGDNRSLDPQAVEDIAKGRVWTGSQAQEIGLVDRLGGLDTAIRFAGEQAKRPLGDGVSVEFLQMHRGWRRYLDDLQHFVGARIAGLIEAALVDHISTAPVRANLPSYR